MNTKEDIIKTLELLGCDKDILHTKVKIPSLDMSKEQYDSLPYFWELFTDKDLNNKDVQYEIIEMSMKAFDMCTEMWIKIIKQSHEMNFDTKHKEDMFYPNSMLRYLKKEAKRIFPKIKINNYEEYSSFRKLYCKYKTISTNLVDMCNDYQNKWGNTKTQFDNYETMKEEMTKIKTYYLDEVNKIRYEYANEFKLILQQLKKYDGNL